MIDYKT